MEGLWDPLPPSPHRNETTLYGVPHHWYMLSEKLSAVLFSREPPPHLLLFVSPIIPRVVCLPQHDHLQLLTLAVLFSSCSPQIFKTSCAVTIVSWVLLVLPSCPGIMMWALFQQKQLPLLMSVWVRYRVWVLIEERKLHAGIMETFRDLAQHIPNSATHCSYTIWATRICLLPKLLPTQPPLH